MPTTQVVLFVNPSSGGGRAREYLDILGSDKVEVELGRSGSLGATAVLRAFDMREGATGNKPGFLELKRRCQEEGPQQLIRVMVAGGDGTVVWAISELVHTGVDLDRVAIGHIPFGTGNDFSRSTGWGPTAPQNLVGANREFLLRDLRKWVFAHVVDFDVWKVEVSTFQVGGFSFVHGPGKGMTEGDKERHSLEELPEGGWRMRKLMVNYASFGQSCRAGLGFEKRRTNSRIGNNALYAWEGLKKLALRPAPLVSDVVDELTIENVTACFDHNSLAVPRLTEPSAELLFLNIPSFAGGADPWAWTSKTALSMENLSVEADLQDTHQSFGDGKLEVLTYGSGAGAAVDAANGKLRLPVRGAGRRLAQSCGPFTADFKSPEDARYTSPDGRVYFQVDGEFFVARQPREMKVSHWRSVKVLQNPAAGVACRCGF